MEEDYELKAIRNQLKLILKHKKISYGEISKQMKCSEVTIKRFFTADDLSFKKLQEICGVAGVSVIELVTIVKESGEQTFSLTHKQEKYFSNNEKLYDFFVLLLKYKSLKLTILKGHFQKSNVAQFLRELEELELIEIPLGDKVKVKKSGVLTWLKNGPLQKKFMRARHIKYLDVFENQLSNEIGYLTSSQRSLRPESVEEMKRDLEFIIHKYRSRAYREESIYPDEDLVGVAWLVGLGKYRQF